jgi:UDP-N-acetylglucosamine 2-epimerase
MNKYTKELKKETNDYILATLHRTENLASKEDLA